MTVEFAFEPNVSRGHWIAERLDDDMNGQPDPDTGLPRDALSATVPSGFDAIVRVLHPFSRDRLVGDTFAAQLARDAAGHDAAGGAAEVAAELENGVSWQETARVHGTRFTASSLSHGVLGLQRDQHRDVESADGWRYHSPEEGSLDSATLARVAAVLAAHTATPDRGVAAVWEGWGGLVSSSSIGFFVAVSPVTSLPRVLQGPIHALQRVRGEYLERTRRFGRAAALSALVRPWRQQPPGSGVLPKAAAAGPRLELSARSYICFTAGITAFAAHGGREWPGRAPWVDDSASWWIQSPNLIWPDAHEWLLVSEIDFDSTLIACSRDCADALLSAEGVEAVEISRDTPLWPNA